MEAYLIIFCAVIIPLFFVYQPTDARNYLFSVTTGLYVLWLAIKGASFDVYISSPMLNVSDLWLIGFGLFYFVSSSWAPNQREGTTTALTWVSGIILYFTIRQVSTELVMLALYVPVLIMIPLVVYQLYSKYRYGGTIEVDGDLLASDAYGVFGNTNYLGVYLSIVFFPGLWLWFNISPWFVVPQVLICIIIYLTRCRAAWAALNCGMAFTLFINGSYTLCSILMVSAITVIVLKLFERKMTGRGIGVSDRFYWSLMALNLIRKKPLFGWGPRAYNIEQNNSMREILPGSKYPSFTDYLHNDWLEILVETGIAGASMFCLFLFCLPWQADPIISGGLAAMLVSSLFFFSFYKAHTFVLFWCLAGLNAKQGIAFTFPWPILVVVLALVFAVLIYQYPFKKSLSIVYWFHGALNSKSKGDFINTVITKCLKNDPYNSLYLSAVYREVAITHPDLAMKCAVRMSEHFDGITSFKFVEKIQPKVTKITKMKGE